MKEPLHGARPHFLGFSPVFYQDYIKRDGNFKSRPISLAPTLVLSFKAETISYIRVSFVSLTLPHGAYLGRICTDSPRAAKRVLSTFFGMTNVAAISTMGFTHCCGDQGLL